MKERQAIQKVSKPLTQDSLLKDLRALGLKGHESVCVHTSLSAIGWILGKEFTLIQALQEALCEGTLIMPAHTGDNSDPQDWEHPPVPSAWWSLIREKMLPFDPVYTPTRGLGITAERFRMLPDVLRSNHPQVSFCAWGKAAETITADHALTPMFGNHSPMGKLYHHGGKVLLLGVGYDTCSLLHYAEYLAQSQPQRQHASSIVNDIGERQWATFLDEDYDNDDFKACGDAYERNHTVVKGRVGEATARLIDARSLVDFATLWFKNNREGSHHA